MMKRYDLIIGAACLAIIIYCTAQITLALF